MLIALLIGVPLGSAAAWWGNKGWRLTILQFIIMLFTCVVVFLVWFAPFTILIKSLASVFLVLAAIYLLWKSRSDARGRIGVPLDQVVMGWVSIIDGFLRCFSSSSW
jgi:ABC-type dipeptide/oligopeptide/nickel transport system permease subunit